MPNGTHIIRTSGKGLDARGSVAGEAKYRRRQTGSPYWLFLVTIWLASQVILPGQAMAPEPMTTATQAVIFYKTPDASPCTIEVREAGSATLVHDLNPALFPNAHVDSRIGTVLLAANLRAATIGRRTAETAIDGRRYSRALQANTAHNYTVTCGAAAPVNGSFRTTNIMLGNAYMEGIPGDPADPGATAWPSLDFSNRAQKIVDPQTGLLLQRLTLANDGALASNATFQIASGAGGWTGAANVLTDDSNAAVFSGPNRDFLHLGYTVGTGATYTHPLQYASQLQVTMNAWCGGGDCSAASVDDRSLEACLTIDGLGCAGDPITVALQNCTIACTGQTHRFTLGDDFLNQQLMPSWFAGIDAYAKPSITPLDMRQRAGTVTRNGNSVTLVSGDRFAESWKAGSKIRINGQTYTVASLQTDRELTLSAAPAGTETGVSYDASAFGVLIRKKTSSETPLHVQHANLRVQIGEMAGAWDSGGGFDQYSNCSHALVAGPGGEMGWHCQISGIFYWIGKDTGTANPLSRTVVQGRSGADGFPSSNCDGYWDKSNGNRLYCLSAIFGNNDTVVLQLDYNGQNEPGDITDIYGGITECGAPPCWTVTNLTRASQGHALNQMVAAFDTATFASYKHVGFRLVTLMGSTKPRLLLRAFPEGVTNDVMGYYAVFNAGTKAIDGAGPSWKYWPARWSAMHGFTEFGDSDVVQWPLTMYRGPHTGVDPYRGFGPYSARVTSGPISNQGQPCPTRPANSLIPIEEWPTGNNCLLITVDGEPGDPTPKMLTSGTVTTSGSTVTGTGVSWPWLSTGYKMKIGTDFFDFTRTSETTGTLSPVPPAVTNSPYILFLEPVANPKTGPNRQEHAYLQDVEARDVLCIVNDPIYGAGGCGDFNTAEYFLVLIKDGNNWTLERGYNKTPVRKQFRAANPNAYAVMMPSACDLQLYPCSTAVPMWSIDQDPLSLGPGIAQSPAGASNGAGHNFQRAKLEVSAVAQFNCPTIDGDGYSCYNVRRGANTLDTLSSTKNHFLTGQPAFSGKIGVGSPNVVESHPSPRGSLDASPGTDVMDWFLDARPMLGGGGITASSGNPATQVETGLYRLTSAQVPKIRRKVLPTFASCGTRPMIDASGPTSLLTGGTADQYKFCVADRNGECHATALAGDVFFNCPLMSTPYCGPGTDADMRDVCIGGHSANTSSVIQLGYEKQDMTGLYGRQLTKGFNRYRLFDFFWNAKSTPDGKWLLVRSNWANGFGHQTLMARIPPFVKTDNTNRADFVPVLVKIPASGIAAETHALIEFGYNTDLYCTSRSEICVKGAASGYAFQYENAPGVSCSTGCEISIPAIPQRVLYYRVVRRNAAGQRLSVRPMEITVTP